MMFMQALGRVAGPYTRPQMMTGSGLKHTVCVDLYPICVEKYLHQISGVV